MIFNRTREDVENAEKIRREKVQTFQPLTDGDIEVLQRGTLTVNSLNRIEGKQEELKAFFNEMGYFNTKTDNKFWDETQIFRNDDFSRILNNTEVLRAAFFVRGGTPNTPRASYHYENINNLEKILFDLGLMVDEVKENYRECGVTVCGGG